ncbi:MAG: hypothetical protein JXA54_03730 [Candidatus Heimdallarchaeota archaeon]|nr:hypothetical protein [Candidatus Heimdallarchaeota archaeon]
MTKKDIQIIKEKVKEIMNNPMIDLFYHRKKESSKGSKEWTNLTKTQLETLIIDIIADEVNEELTYLEKGEIRAVTKRSFYRTLEQARLNLIRAIFTIMIASVLNIIDSPRLSDFNNLSQNFLDLITVSKLDDQTPEEKEKWINVYTKMIFENVKKLKRQSALSNVSK